jgi:hypothetical protein
MATVVRKVEEVRPVWWKTRPCGKQIGHRFDECPYHHQSQGVDDRHLLWPELKQSVPWNPERFAAQQRYYDAQKYHHRQEQKAALDLERRMKFLEFEARGELKAIGCRVTAVHDWPSCRFGHSRLNPKTNMIENDFDEEAIERRKQRIAQEKAERKQQRLEARVQPTEVNFPALGQT